MLPPTEQIGTHNSCLEKSVSNEYSFIELHHEWINKYTDVLSFLRSFYILYTYHWILLSSQDLLSYAQSEIKAKNIYQRGFKRRKFYFISFLRNYIFRFFFFNRCKENNIICRIVRRIADNEASFRNRVYRKYSYNLIPLIHRVLN